jgi:hypothetical protein
VPIPVDVSINKDKYFDRIHNEKYVPELIFLFPKFGSNPNPSKSGNDHSVSENIIWDFMNYLLTYSMQQNPSPFSALSVNIPNLFRSSLEI